MEKGELHLSLSKMSRTHHRRVHAEFAKVGLSHGQPRILNYLANNDGCIQKDLSDNCHIEPATVTSVLSSMERVGLIYRKNNPRDRRVLNVFLTEKGKEVQNAIQNTFHSLEEECFYGFTEEEKIQAMSFLKRMNENMKKGEQNKGEKVI